MDYFKKFEDRVEDFLEGRFLPFQTAVHPMEIVRAVIRKLRERRRQVLHYVFAPDCYRIGISPENFDQYRDSLAFFESELVRSLRFEASEMDVSFFTEPRADVSADRALALSELAVTSFYADRRRDRLDAYRDVLAVREGFSAGEVFFLSEREAVLGRKGDLVLSDPMISSRHCRILSQEKGCFLEDLDSRNGTSVNGRPVKTAALSDGDEIALGSGVLVYRRI